jgi:predicted restriction endonuclease
MPWTACLVCGKLGKGRSYCTTHQPDRSTPGRGGGWKATKFREAVLAQAGWRCEAKYISEAGRTRRCTVNNPQKLQAHHVRPIIEGGDAFDPDNGMALCQDHHRIAEKMLREAAIEAGKPTD